MPTAHVNGLNLYYEQAGSGPPLLFISGTGGDLRNKPNQFDGPFPKVFDMVSYDQRGLGRSAKPDVAYTMADYADDASALMGELGVERAHIVGVSFGGMVAQELVLRHPRRVDRLVLACTSPGGAGGASFPFHEIDHLKGEDRARHLTPISDTRRDTAWAEANPDTYRQIIAMSSANPYGEEPGHEMGARRQLEARAHHDTWDRLTQIEAPTLIAAGRYDGIALPATQEYLASRIKGSVLRFFEGGHLFMIQDRTATATMIRFLNGEEV